MDDTFRPLLSPLLSILFSLIVAQESLAMEVGGVQIPNDRKLENKELVLNGAGIRTKFFVNVYVGSLYLEEKQTSADNIIRSDEPMVVRLDVISNLVTNEKMKNATLAAFERATHGDSSGIQANIDAYLAAFDDQIKRGDRFDFVYLPSEGLKVYKNEQFIKTIAGLDFKKALFATWLGEQPSQETLKKSMLGL